MEHEPRPPLHILVVDDEPDLEPLIKQRMRRQIRSGKYVFEFADNGAGALEILSSDNRFDMVVTDINMPQMDGLALLGHISRAWPDIKSIVVSAYGDMRNIRTAMNCGAFDFITKPVDFEDFEATITRTHDQIVQWKEVLQSRDRLVARQSELDMASGMRQAILPVDFPRGDGFDIHGCMAPAQVVGGDFFDVMTLERGRIGLAVADVSERGAPAVGFMMSSRALLKGSAIGLDSPDRVLAEVNNLLHEDNRNVMFVTVLYAVYDPGTGTVTYANGGHCDPFVVRADGSSTPLPGTGGVVLGLSADLEYTRKTAALEPGETLVMYSDGVPDAKNREGEGFGAERLQRIFEDAPPGGAEEASTRVLEAVARFAGEGSRSDDVTCLALHRAGGP